MDHQNVILEQLFFVVFFHAVDRNGLILNTFRVLEPFLDFSLEVLDILQIRSRALLFPMLLPLLSLFQLRRRNLFLDLRLSLRQSSRFHFSFLKAWDITIFQIGENIQFVLGAQLDMEIIRRSAREFVVGSRSDWSRGSLLGLSLFLLLLFGFRFIQNLL